jgi:predicted peroxiredoxin
MKMVVWATAGADDPTKASIPLHVVANGCVEVGHDSAIILAGDAAEIVVGANSETIEGVGIPPVRELLAKLKEHSVPVYV